MARLRRDLERSRPDCIAVMTPHGVVVDGAMTVLAGTHTAGELDDFRLEAALDRPLTAAWAYHGVEQNVPVAPIVSVDPVDPLPLDWGVTIPIALLAPVPSLPLSVACPSRALDRGALTAWGSALVTAADELDQRVAFIVSADQGHGHAPDGPYGFSAESAEFDRAMCEAISKNDLASLLDWDEDWIEAALADSYWQTLALVGIQQRLSLRPRLLSYEIDHYFGMLCAGFEILS
jgi:aromatic ring-opening dioxygenase LigB subunit